MRDKYDKIHMVLPPHYKECFKLRHPNIKLTDGKVNLIIQLFNVFQGSADSRKKCNNLPNKVLGKLDITRSSRDLAEHARRVNGALVILNVSTDNTLASTDSHIIRTKTINHLKRFFPKTAKEGSVLSYLNYGINQ